MQSLNIYTRNVLCLLLTCISTTVLPQEFVLEWETDDQIYYVGDMDNDGVGELYKSDNMYLRFYDGATYEEKWLIPQPINGVVLSYPSESPLFDFTGDGVAEFIIWTENQFQIRDLTTSLNIFEFTSQQGGGFNFQSIADIDGDGIYELIFHKTPFGGGQRTTYIYSTGVVVTSISSHDSEDIVPTLLLKQNFPNPFNGSTSIEYSLERSNRVKLSVHNVLGQRITILVDEKQAAGDYKAQWNSMNDLGESVSSGTYFLLLEIEGVVSTRKAVVVR